MKTNSRLVYSTDFGAACPDCGKPKNNCICRQIKKTESPKSAGPVRVRYETAGRKGKGVTLITGLPLNEQALVELSRKLKQQLATGGAVKDGTIELQGDMRERAREALRRFGHGEKT